MRRREFIVQSASAGAMVYGLPNRGKAKVDGDFIDKIGHSVIAFLDDEWDDATLEDELYDALDVACYAYGEVIGDRPSKSEQESGYLTPIRDIEWNELKTNPEAFNWLFDYIDKIAHFIGVLDVFSDRIANAMETVAEKAAEAKQITKFLPLVWNVKRVLDSGCRIHHRIDSPELGVDKDTYIKFFKHIALVIVELILLGAGGTGAYKAAFQATSKVNSLLVNAVGQRIGWKAYSWVLSLVHWGIRVIYADGIGKAINETTEAVVGKLVKESPFGREKAESEVDEDVHAIARRSDGWFDRDYWRWKKEKKAKRQIGQAEQQIDELIDLLPYV